MRGHARILRVSLLIACVCTLFAGPPARAESVRVDLEISRTDLVRRGAPDAIRYELAGGRSLRDFGQPVLPIHGVELLIPRDRIVEAVRLEGGREISLGIPPGLATDEGQTIPEWGIVPEVSFDPSMVEAATHYPPLRARVVSDNFEHGFHLVGVEVFPLRLDRATGELRLLEGAHLVAELGVRRDGRAVVERERRIAGWGERVRDGIAARIANPDALEREDRSSERIAVPAGAPAAKKTPSLATSPVLHLIVTNEVMRPEFQRLADYRTQQGLPSVVVTVTDILANSRQGVDLAETIRFFIADAYAKWGVDYLLLGGDSDVIPPRYVTSTFYPPGSSTEIPADLYYGALEGNWNADGDSFFGEPFVSGANLGDFTDFAAEVAVGRAPVNTLASAQTFVNKVLAYEQPIDTDYQTGALFASEVLFPASWEEGEGIQLDGAFFSEDMIDSMLACAPELLPTRLYENNTAYPGATQETKAGVLSALDSGQYGIYHHIGHGFYFNMSVGDNTIVPADVDVLTNGPNYFLLYSLNCSSSAFDFDCLNERFLESPAGGSVISIGSCRAAFPNTANDYQHAFYRAWLCEGKTRVGDAVVASRQQGMINTFYNTSDRWTQFVYTLLGDPATQLWGAAPRAVNVIAPASLDLGANQVVVGVQDVETSTGQPGVTVTLTKNGEDYATGVTDGTGVVTLNFSPETTGEVMLWASGAGVVPMGTNIPVVDAGAPYPSVESLALSDDGVGQSIGNGNGRLEGGERVEIIPLVRNAGSATLTATTTTLRVDDAFVTLLDSTVAVPTLLGGSSAVAADPFVIEFDPATPDGHEVVLRFVTPSQDIDPWVDEETLLLASPEIEVVDVSFDDSITGNDDGVLQAGEVVELLVTLKNFGAGALGSMTGVLTSSSGSVVISDASASWDGVGGVLQLVTNDADRFALREDDLLTQHEYELTLTDDQGRVLVHSFDLRAPIGVLGLGLGFGGTGEVVLTWTSSTDADLFGYRVYRKAEGQPDFEVASPDVIEGSAYFRDSGLTPLSRFEYQVAAVDSGRVEGPRSAAIVAATAPPEISCFPLPLGLETSGDLAVSHLDNDGVLDMVIGADVVYAIDGTCAEKSDGDDDAQTFGPITDVAGKYGPASIALANLDPDGGMEIVASSWGTSEIYVFDELGNILPGWPVLLRAKNWSTPAVDDIDGDGDYEIVLNDTSGYTYAFHHDGTEVADGDSDPTTFGVIVPRRVDASLVESFGRTSPALYDVDDDGQLEILFGSKYQNGRNETFWAWNADGSATNAPGWPKVFAPGSEFLASPTIADIDDDGSDEILQLCENDSLYVWRPDGTRVAPFPVQLVSQAVNKDSLAPSVAVGDFTLDGRLEMVVVETLGGSKPKSRINVIDWQGATLSGWPKTVDNLSEASPVVGDIDGDGELDIVFGVGGGSDNQPNFLYAWDKTGGDVKGFPILLNGFVRATPTICDLDGDGTVNIALASWDRLIHVWDMGSTYDETLVPWPTFRGNVNRNGVFGHLVRTEAPLLPGVGRRSLLHPNVPNPFNPATRLDFVLEASAASVRLSVFDAQGRRVRTLLEGSRPAGSHSVLWNGLDGSGRPVSSGVYYAQLEVDGAVVQTRKMALVK